MIRPIEIIKSWFMTGKKPTQAQFWDWLDSFRHKDESISIDEVAELAGVLNDKANLQSTQTQLDTLNVAMLTHTSNVAAHIQPVPSDGMDSVWGESGIYSDEDYEYFVTYHHSNLFPSRRTYQLRLGKKTGTLEIRSRAGNQADWTDWTNLTDLKANKIVTPVTTYHYDTPQTLKATGAGGDTFPGVGEIFEIYLDIQNCILAITGQDEFPTFDIIQEGISSYEETWLYGNWSNGTEYAYIELEATPKQVEGNVYTDLSAVREELLQLDTYLRNNFYTKSVADNTFQKKTHRRQLHCTQARDNCNPLLTLYRNLQA